MQQLLAPVCVRTAEAMSRNPQSHAKRARDHALKERRERKRVRKAARAASRSTSAEHDLPPNEDLAEAQDGLVEPPDERNGAINEISA
jgi:hypothetical protein